MGVVEAPPLIILDKEGEPPQGIVINRLESIFTSAGLELQYLPLTTARVNKELNDGKVDGFPLFFGNQFQQFSELKFSDVYYKLPVYLWCSPKTCTSPKDLESVFDNKRLILGVRKYAKYGESVNLVIKEFSGRIYESRNDNTLIDLLYSGKIDIMFTFSSTIAQYRKNNNLDNVFIRSHSPFYIAEYRIIFSEKDASNKLLQDINTAIEKVQ
jgi:ABC-type amino acid transport substrate-binding protein